MHPLLSSRPMLLNVRIFASLTRMYRMIFLIEIGLLISVMTESNFYSSTLHLGDDCGHVNPLYNKHVWILEWNYIETGKPMVSFS